MNCEERILLVDDDVALLDVFSHQLGRRFSIVTAASGEEALRLLAEGNQFAVVVSDQRMRGIDGAALLGEFSRRVPATVRILLTGLHGQEVAVRAINQGHVFSFLNKPVVIEELISELDRALAHGRIQRNEREFIDRTVNDIVLS